jgi:hypothetical protein
VDELDVLAYATTGFHRARAQSALADGARARNRTRRVHGINATSVTAYKPPFPISRNMLPISVSLSITKFLPEQRVDQDRMIQLLDRSIEHEHEHEHEHEKQPEHNHAPKWPFGRAQF